MADLSRFVLGDLVLRMLLAVLAFTVGPSRLGHIDLYGGKVSASIKATAPISISFQTAPARK